MLGGSIIPCFFQFLLLITGTVSGDTEVPNSPAADHDHLQVKSVTVAETDGGAYYTWLDSDTSSSPVLDQSKIGAGKLVLHPRGFALPHYADSYKIGFVIQGTYIYIYMLKSHIARSSY